MKYSTNFYEISWFGVDKISQNISLEECNIHHTKESSSELSMYNFTFTYIFSAVSSSYWGTNIGMIYCNLITYVLFNLLVCFFSHETFKDNQKKTDTYSPDKICLI